MTTPKRDEEKLFLPDPRPEPVVVFVRAVCGVLGGIFTAVVVWATWYDELGRMATILLFALLPVVFAYLAVRGGDAFWERWRRNPFW